MTNLIHIPLNHSAFMGWINGRGLAVDGHIDFGHASHVFLSALFGKGTFQPFRLRTGDPESWSFMGVSRFSAEELLHMSYLSAGPELLSAIKRDRIAGRVLPRNFDGVRRIGYDICFTPVRRKDGRERDAWICEAEHRFPGENGALLRSGVTREDVYRKWFSERMAKAGELESFRVSSFRMQTIVRSGKIAQAPVVNAQGTLLISDGNELCRLIEEGVGRGKAYGFGLLQLRPADKEPEF